MYYTEYDDQGNLKTSIIGNDQEVAEAIKHHKGDRDNNTRIKSSPTFELAPKIIQKHITKYDTTNVQFSKPEVQKMFVGHEDELRRVVGRSINEKNVAAVFSASDILDLFNKHNDELRRIVGNSLSSRNVNISQFSVDDIRSIYGNDKEALQSIVERRIAVDEENAKRASSSDSKSFLINCGLIGLLGFAVYQLFKSFE